MRLTDDLTVSLVTGICILALAVVSKYFLDVELDFVSQYGPVWIYMVYVAGDKAKRSQRSTVLWSATIVIATLAILVVYAI
jgi:hypothetical protein